MDVDGVQLADAGIGDRVVRRPVGGEPDDLVVDHDHVPSGTPPVLVDPPPHVGAVFGEQPVEVLVRYDPAVRRPPRADVHLPDARGIVGRHRPDRDAHHGSIARAATHGRVTPRPCARRCAQADLRPEFARTVADRARQSGARDAVDDDDVTAGHGPACKIHSRCRGCDVRRADQLTRSGASASGRLARLLSGRRIAGAVSPRGRGRRRRRGPRRQRMAWRTR